MCRSQLESQCSTLRQLQNVICRRNVKKEPKDNLNACQEFFALIVHSHVLCAAMEVLQMDGHPGKYKVLPPRVAHQVIWSRTINTHTDGIPGYNISCDLYIEHINRLLKQCIHNLHANKTEKAIHVASMGPVNSIIQNFDQKHSLFRSDAHSLAMLQCH